MKKTLSFSEDFVNELIYNSLLFENRSITLEEVMNVCNGKEEEYDPKRVLLIKNHKNAFNFVVNLVNEEKELSENALKDIHQTLMENIGVGGLYRNVDISISGSNHTPCSHIKVYDRMKKYFDTVNSEGGDLMEKIAFSHVQLAKIHPFLDGNGRCARLVMNYFLMKNNYHPIIFPANERDEYFNYIEQFKVNKDIVPFKNYMISLVEKYN